MPPRRQTKKPVAAAPPAPKRPAKRKAEAEPEDEPSASAPAKKKAKSTEEKRLRRYRPQAPQDFYTIFERATTQRGFDFDGCPAEHVELTGSTGNIYTVRIARQPTCTCPHNQKGNQCKHIIYVLSRVLRAPFDHVYQLALLSSELQTIFDASPLPDPPSSSSNTEADTDSPSEDSKDRKPVEGDCPICFTEFNPTSKAKDEKITWCREGCGQNVHVECFRMWARTKSPDRPEDATCPYCRGVWGADPAVGSGAAAALASAGEIRKDGPVNEEGYVNVADQLGISSARDRSTYHIPRHVYARAYSGRRYYSGRRGYY